MLGEDPTLDYLAEKKQGDRARDRVQIASRIRQGPGWSFPYRDFPIEYPPLPLLLMLLPRAFANSLPSYRSTYGICAAAIVCLPALSVPAFAANRILDVATMATNGLVRPRPRSDCRRAL